MGRCGSTRWDQVWAHAQVQCQHRQTSLCSAEYAMDIAAWGPSSRLRATCTSGNISLRSTKTELPTRKYNGVAAAKLRVSFAGILEVAADAAAAATLCQQVGCTRPCVVQRVVPYAAAVLSGARFVSLGCIHLRSSSMIRRSNRSSNRSCIPVPFQHESLNPAEPRRR